VNSTYIRIHGATIKRMITYVLTAYLYTSKNSYSRNYKQRHTSEANPVEDLGQDLLHVFAFFVRPWWRPFRGL